MRRQIRRVERLEVAAEAARVLLAEVRVVLRLREDRDIRRQEATRLPADHADVAAVRFHVRHENVDRPEDEGALGADELPQLREDGEHRIIEIEKLEVGIEAGAAGTRSRVLQKRIPRDDRRSRDRLLAEMADRLVIADGVADVTVDADRVVVARWNNPEVKGIVAQEAVHANVAG
jgi:hypothetical protein